MVLYIFLDVLACVNTHLRTHPPTHSPTHPPTHPPTHSLTRSLTHALPIPGLANLLQNNLLAFTLNQQGGDFSMVLYIFLGVESALFILPIWLWLKDRSWNRQQNSGINSGDLLRGADDKY